MKLGEKIKILRKQRKMTMQDLADASDLSKGYISMLEKGENPQSKKPIVPSLNTVSNIAESLGFTIEQLLENVDSEVELPELSLVSQINKVISQLNNDRQTTVYNFATNQLNEQQVEETSATYHTVEVYSLLSAGTGIVDLDPTDTTEIELDGHIPQHDLAFKVRGDSMEPVFENGEIVFVKKTQDIHNGQIIAVQINEEAYIKKVYINNDHMRLVSLNKEYDDIIANKNDDIRVVGKVLI